jgi:DNA-binding CsgD family transcriptional regulator/tetratricopeptide (TPR) repeat protein
MHAQTLFATTFVGREAELVILRAGLADALAGRGRIALVAGEPGIGKTRLAEELAAAAERQGAQAIWGRCYEGQGAPAFWPWVQILRAAVRGRDPETLRAELGPGAAHLAALVPGLPASPPALPSHFESAEDRFRLFDSVTTFLAAAADRQPLLLLLDDLHWADVPTLLLLEFFARELRGARLLVLGSFRDVEVHADDPLARTLGRLARLADVARLTLSGLAVAEVGRLIVGLTGAPARPDVVAAVHRETEGNPFFVAELVRLLARERQLDAVPARPLPLPPNVRDVIGLRLARLSDACRRALTLAAVIGLEFDASTLAEVGSEAGDRLLVALGEADAAQLVTPAPAALGRYRFGHALVRETLYEGLPRVQRMALHRRVGAALERRWSDDPDRLAELAYHFLQAAPAGPVEKAVSYAGRAAERATRQHAHESAAALYELALQALALRPRGEEPRRCELLIALGEARTRSGDVTAGQRAFVEAAEAARRLASGGGPADRGAILLARAALGFGGTGVALGSPDPRQVPLLEEALAALGHSERDRHTPLGSIDGNALRARLLARLALAQYWTRQRERSWPLSLDALAVARRSGDLRAIVHALRVRRYVIGGPEHLAERSALTAEVLQLAEALGDAELTLLGLRGRVVDSLELGDPAALDAAIARYAELAEQLRQPYYRWYATLLRAMRALVAGHFADGERLAEEARKLGALAGDPDAEMFYALQVLDVWAERGRLDDLVAAMKGLVERYPVILSLRCRLAALQAELGRDDEARQELERLASPDPSYGSRGAAFSQLPDDVNWLPCIVFLARACVRLADGARAAVLYDLLRPYAGRNVVTGTGIASLGPTDRWLGELAAALGRWEVAARHFDDALDLATRMGARPQVAAIQHAHAAMQCQKVAAGRGETGDVARARELLTRAGAAARELGMDRLAGCDERLTTQLAALPGAPGFRPTDVLGTAAPAGQHSAEGLSGREIEVLRLIAAGHTNREIAAELVVSVKTVMHHSVSIYRKLRVRGRAEATAYAVGHGLADPPPPDR